MATHTEGPGLKIMSNRRWYGTWGGCSWCGSQSTLIPVCVRFWDVDDGWRVDVLCDGCGEQAAGRGPKERDFAYHKAGSSKLIDELFEILDGDEDSLATQVADGVLNGLEQEI